MYDKFKANVPLKEAHKAIQPQKIIYEAFLEDSRKKILILLLEYRPLELPEYLCLTSSSQIKKSA